MADQQAIQRREFLESLGIGAAGLITAGYSATAVGYPANETLTVGLLGTGGRCIGALLPALKEIPGVKIAAVCDVWDAHLERAKGQADPSALATKNFQEVLDQKDIDAVVIASPDHWHVPMTVAACDAGKDVYVEKPLTHDLAEGQAAIDAQNRNQRIVQVGMQQRSMPQFLKAYEEVVKPGKLGKIHKVHLTWNRNAPIGGRGKYGIDPKTVDWKGFLGQAKDQPFDEFRFRNWRWFWDFGGGILTDLMVHFIDVAHWYLGLDHPSTAVTIGDHFATRGVWETPDTIQTILQYPDQEVQIYFEGTFLNARNAAMLEFMGRDATLYLDRGRYEVHPERGKGAYSEFVPGKGGRGADFDPNINCGLLHLANWIECVRGRKRPSAPAEAGASACKPAHLGNRAYLTGQTARWMM
ncbi:MAG: Gfo/Idh/MocA family oxidoreductase [Planctomycetes bacterium]|nr:Gfo/Idh/MocA family oxidoreductase [Planctomycetota bacterium]